MQIPMMAAMYPPLRIERYRGKRAVKSQPAEIELAATLSKSLSLRISHVVKKLIRTTVAGTTH